MPQTVRLTITSELEKALAILHQSTLGTLNTTELIKLAIGELARIKEKEMNPNQLDQLSAQLFATWAQEDGSQLVENIAQPEKLQPFSLETTDV